MSGRLGFTPARGCTKTQLNYLLKGQNWDGEIITKEHKVKGIDLTLSTPRSVSIVGLVMEKTNQNCEKQRRLIGDMFL